MPLRDHFRPPIWTKSSWEGFHGMWPATLVQRLVKYLPEDFTAEPRVHLRALFEIDVCAYEDDEPKSRAVDEAAGGVATAVWTAPAPRSSPSWSFPISMNTKCWCMIRVEDAS